MVTLCFEELWYEGPADTPPDGQLVFYDPSICFPCPYYTYPDEALRSSIASPAGRGCRITGRQCELFPAVMLHTYSLSSHVTRENLNDGNNVCDTYADVRIGGGDTLEPQQVVTDFVDAGCTPLTVDDERTAFFSVWYP